MSLIDSCYTNTHSQDGIDYVVLDAKKLYEDRASLEGQMSYATRSEPVYLWKPKMGDSIVESGRPPAIANGTETVFIKKLNADGMDLKVYIPSGSDGPLDDSILDEKYLGREAFQATSDNPVMKFIHEHAQSPDTIEIYQRHPNPELSIDILHEIIDRDAIILNARGEGKHQTLKAGDSLKFEDGECLPLPKKELDVAWRVTAIDVAATPGALTDDLTDIGTVSESAMRQL